MKSAIASGRYPTSADRLAKDIREKIQTESTAAAKPLCERFEKMQADLQREREAEGECRSLEKVSCLT
jgi:hypothetical protein